MALLFLLSGRCGGATVVGQQRTAAGSTPSLLHDLAPPAGHPLSGRTAASSLPPSLLDGVRNPSSSTHGHGHGEPAGGAAGTLLPSHLPASRKEGWKEAMERQVQEEGHGQACYCPRHGRKVQRPEEVEQQPKIRRHLPPNVWTTPCSERGYAWMSGLL